MDNKITPLNIYSRFDKDFNYEIICTDIILENVLYTLENHLIGNSLVYVANIKEVVNKNVNELTVYSIISYNNELYHFRYNNLTTMVYFFQENNTDNIEKFIIKSHFDNRDMCYYSVDGVVYGEVNFNRIQELIAYPAGKKDKEFIVPDFVSKIDLQSFFNNKFIKRLTIKNKNVKFSSELINTTLEEIDLYNKKIVINKFGKWMLQKRQ